MPKIPTIERQVTPGPMASPELSSSVERATARSGEEIANTTLWSGNAIAYHNEKIQAAEDDLEAVRLGKEIEDNINAYAEQLKGRTDYKNFEKEMDQRSRELYSQISPKQASPRLQLAFERSFNHWSGALQDTARAAKYKVMGEQGKIAISDLYSKYQKEYASAATDEEKSIIEGKFNESVDQFTRDMVVDPIYAKNFKENFREKGLQAEATLLANSSPDKFQQNYDMHRYDGIIDPVVLANIKNHADKQREILAREAEKKQDDAYITNTLKMFNTDWKGQYDIQQRFLNDPEWAATNLGPNWVENKLKVENAIRSQQNNEENARKVTERKWIDENWVGLHQGTTSIREVEQAQARGDIGPQVADYSIQKLTNPTTVKTDTMTHINLMDRIFSADSDSEMTQLRREIFDEANPRVGNHLSHEDAGELLRLTYAKQEQAKKHYTSDPYFDEAKNYLRTMFGLLDPFTKMELTLQGVPVQKGDFEGYHKAIISLMGTVESKGLKGKQISDEAEAIWKASPKLGRQPEQPKGAIGPQGEVKPDRFGHTKGEMATVQNKNSPDYGKPIVYVGDNTWKLIQ